MKGPCPFALAQHTESSGFFQTFRAKFFVLIWLIFFYQQDFFQGHANGSGCAAESLSRKKTKIKFECWVLTKFWGSSSEKISIQPLLLPSTAEWAAPSERESVVRGRLAEPEKGIPEFAALHRGHFALSSLWTRSRTRKAKLSRETLKFANSDKLCAYASDAI